MTGGGGVDEVLAEGDGVGFKEEDEGGASEGKIALLIPFGIFFSRSVGLVDGADVGGADFKEENVAEGFGGKGGQRPLVLGEDFDVLLDGDGVNRVEGTVDHMRFPRYTIAGEVEAVVVGRAEAGHDHGATRIFLSKLLILEQGCEIELLPFDDETIGIGDIWVEPVAPIGGDDGRSFADGASIEFELSDKKVIEGVELIWREEKFRGIDTVLFDKGEHFAFGVGGFLPAAIEVGEE